MKQVISTVVYTIETPSTSLKKALNRRYIEVHNVNQVDQSHHKGINITHNIQKHQNYHIPTRNKAFVSL